MLSRLQYAVDKAVYVSDVFSSYIDGYGDGDTGSESGGGLGSYTGSLYSVYYDYGRYNSDANFLGAEVSHRGVIA